MLVDVGGLGLDARVDAARRIVTVLVGRGLASTGVVDCVSDVRAPELPADVADALAWIKERAPARRRLFGPPEPTYMAVEVDLADATGLGQFLAFAPYSIHAEVLDASGATALVLHDTSTSVSVDVADPAVLAEVRRALGTGTGMPP